MDKNKENSVILIGDTHDLMILGAMVRQAPEDMPIIQVGDIGIWPEYQERYRSPIRPVHFIEGNHDYMPFFKDRKEVAPIWENLVYIPRGTVMELNGLRIGFLGGATSVDREWRTYNGMLNEHGWFPEEEVFEHDCLQLIHNAGKEPLDLLVTHAPPECAIAPNFEREGFLKAFNLPPDWVDSSARRVERVWKALGNPPLVCGHMHRSVNWNNVRILDINEIYIFKKNETES